MRTITIITKRREGYLSTLSYNDKLHQLTISDTKGTFKGMLKKRTFNIVMVNGTHGSNTGTADKTDKSVVYLGKKMVVKL
jgi:alpha-D-xyloside xylohydrolase